MWICPSCYSSGEPVWNWETIQDEEAIRVPTCPDCGYEMEQGEPCPLCGEAMRSGKAVCFDCWRTLTRGLVMVADSVALKNTAELTKWEAIRDIAETMVVRFEEMEKRKK